MRAREKARIAKARANLRNARRRLKRSDLRELPPGGHERDDTIKKTLAARQAVNAAISRLETKLKAPARAIQVDAAKRPGRYRDAKKTRFEAAVQLKIAERAIQRIAVPVIGGALGTAHALIAAARKAGRDIKSVYRQIAAKAGLSSHDIFTIFHYSTT